MTKNQIKIKLEDEINIADAAWPLGGRRWPPLRPPPARNCAELNQDLSKLSHDFSTME